MFTHSTLGYLFRFFLLPPALLPPGFVPLGVTRLDESAARPFVRAWAFAFSCRRLAHTASRSTSRSWSVGP
jgi:hypothetical protein